MTLQIESLTATLSGPLSALGKRSDRHATRLCLSGRSACTCGLSPVLSDLLHAHRRYLRSTARVHLSALQACHPLAPSCPGCGVQLGDADVMGPGRRTYPGRSRADVDRGHRMADRLRYRLCLR